MSFRFPEVLLLLIIQIVIWLLWYMKSKNQGNIFPNASEQVILSINRNMNLNLIQWKNRLFLIGVVILTISASGPQIGTRVRPIERKGVDLVIALDTSISMDAKDVVPSRLEKAKFEISRLINSLKGDRVAIIVFAGSSHLYLPLTTDYEAALLFLREIDTAMIKTQGTSLSSAMNTALNAFSDASDKFKVMLIISDGEDHEGKAIDLAKKVADLGMMVNTVGVGSKDGSLIPVNNAGKNKSSYKRDNDGILITSTLNEVVLKEIALAGQGSYFWFGNSQDTYFEIAEAIQNMEKKIITTHEYFEFEDRYQLFALLALILFMIAFVIPTRKSIK